MLCVACQHPLQCVQALQVAGDDGDVFVSVAANSDAFLLCLLYGCVGSASVGTSCLPHNADRDGDHQTAAAGLCSGCQNLHRPWWVSIIILLTVAVSDSRDQDGISLSTLS